MNCICCNSNEISAKAIKWGIMYAKCNECGSIFTNQDITGVIENENDGSVQRNVLPLNRVRLQRVEKTLGRMPLTALDFGCGDNYLVNYLNSHSIQAHGIDQDTVLQLKDIPKDNYDVVFMIEVIEHLTNPRETFAQLEKVLKPGGIITIETTFADRIGADHTYVDPKIGHVNIVSMNGLGKLLPDNMRIAEYTNPNVLMVRKNDSITR